MEEKKEKLSGLFQCLQFFLL